MKLTGTVVYTNLPLCKSNPNIYPGDQLQTLLGPMMRCPHFRGSQVKLWVKGSCSKKLPFQGFFPQRVGEEGEVMIAKLWGEYVGTSINTFVKHASEI